MIKNISFIYEERIQNYKLFMLVDCFAVLVFGIGMYLLTKPIEKFSDISQEISKGNYKKRVNLKNKKDEIGRLADNFNVMIKAVEDNILELNKLNDSKQRFIDSLTHELKTPLTSIIGYSELLIKGNINENIRFKALNYINSEAKRLEKLSFTLLKLILIKKNDLSFENLSLKQCIYNACSTLNYKLQNKSISLNIEMENKNIVGDKQLIVILFINFLDNAIKASKDANIIEIQGDFCGEINEYILIFKDYGIGIGKEELNKIKEPFYMVDKARDRANNGIGLGLAICDEICNVHNIKFDIRSEENRGTEVILKFSEENNLL